MTKPLACNEKGLLWKNSITRILPRSTTKNQVIYELSHYISGDCFTEAIDLLEKRGITSDVALFIVANLQNLEAAG